MSSDNKKLPLIRDGLAEAVCQRIIQSMRSVLAGELPVSSCLSCVHFNEPNEICGRYNQRPPARVIANGCPEYIDYYDVPF